MTTEALKKENLRLATILAGTKAEKVRLDGIIAAKYAEVKRWNDLYHDLYKEKVIAPDSAEVQRITTVLAATETEKNRLAGLVAEKNSEVTRWCEMYTKLYEEKVVTPDNAPDVEMKRLTAVCSDMETEKNRLAALVVEKDAEIKRWYDMYTNLYKQETVTPEKLSEAEVQRLTAILADAESEKNRLAGMIAEKDVEIRRWYDLYNGLYAKTIAPIETQ